MLVNRYFGSKEQLFAEAAAATMAEPVILADANLQGPERAAQMARALVAITTLGKTPLEGFQMMLHSAASETAAKIGRAEIDKRYQELLTASLQVRTPPSGPRSSSPWSRGSSSCGSHSSSPPSPKPARPR